MVHSFPRLLTWALLGSELRERTHLFCSPSIHIPRTHVCWMTINNWCPIMLTELNWYWYPDMNLDTQRPSHFLTAHKLSFLLQPQCLKLRNNNKKRNSVLLPSRLLYTLFSHCLLEPCLFFQSLAFLSLESVSDHCNKHTYLFPPACSTARTLQTFMCIQTTWESCY